MTTIAHSSASTTTNAIVHGQWVSDPLVAQTISGTVLLQMLCSETNNLNNAFLGICIRVVSNDGLTVQATLLSLATGTGATEFAQTTRTNRKVNPSLSSYTCVDGDRLCIEIGHSKTIASAGGHNNSLRIGDAAGSDLANDESSTADNNPYVEFSGAVTIATAISSSDTGSGADTNSALSASPSGAETSSTTEGNSISGTFSAQAETGAGADANAPYSPSVLPWGKYRPSFYGWLAGTGKTCTVAFGPGDSISSLFNAQDGGSSPRYVDGYAAAVGNAIQAMRQSGGSAKPSIYVPAMMPKSFGTEVWPEGTSPWTDVGTASLGSDGFGGLMEVGIKMNNGGRSIVVPSGYTHAIIQYARLSGNNVLVVKYDGVQVFTDSPTSGTEMRQAEIALGSDNKVLEVRNTAVNSMLFTGVIFEDRTGANGSYRALTAGHGGWGADTWANPVGSPVGVQSGDTAKLWADCQALLDVDLTVIFLGPNDARHDSSGMPGVDGSAQFATDLTALVTALDAAFAAAGKVKPDLFFVAYPYIDGTIGDPSQAYSSSIWAAYVADMAATAATYGNRAQFLDLGTVFGPLDGNSAETSSLDNFHPNALGHSKIKQGMLPYLAQLPAVASAETAAGTEAVTRIGLSAAETGSAADAGTFIVSISNGDTGSDTETATIQLSASSSEAGSGTETNLVSSTFSSSETGSGAEGTGSVSVTLSASDSATDQELEALLRSTTEAETGSGSDTGNVTQVSLSDSESASANEIAFIGQGVVDSETGSGLETASVSTTFSSADVGSGADAASISVAQSSAETGAGVENQTPVPSTTSAETASGTETQLYSAGVSSSDSGSGVDLGVKDEVFRLVSSADSALGVETHNLLLDLQVEEVGTSSEGNSISYSIIDFDFGLGNDSSNPIQLVSFSVTGELHGELIHDGSTSGTLISSGATHGELQ